MPQFMKHRRKNHREQKSRHGTDKRGDPLAPRDYTDERDFSRRQQNQKHKAVNSSEKTLPDHDLLPYGPTVRHINPYSFA